MSYSIDKLREFATLLREETTTENLENFQQKLQEDAELKAIAEDFEAINERLEQENKRKERHIKEMAELEKMPPKERMAFALEKLGMKPVPETINDAMEQKGVKPFSYRQFYRYAAVAAVVILTVIAWMITRTDSPQQVLADHYIAYQEQRQTMSGDTNSGVLQEAEQAFSQQDYSSVILQLEGYPSRTNNMDKLLAHTYFQQQDFAASAALFEKLSTNDKAAQWNYIVVRLMMNQSDPDALEELQRLAQSESLYSTKAKALFSALTE